jgi:hypothetical protein
MIVRHVVHHVLRATTLNAGKTMADARNLVAIADQEIKEQ